jgi:hypothetical protein
LYVRGLVEQGGRKSLQPTLFRLEETAARYESLQQFLVDSPWEPQLVIRACADRVRPRIGLVAWAVDDTGIVRTASILWGCEAADSGTLDKIGNRQITVSMHAVGERGTVPACDAPRRRPALLTLCDPHHRLVRQRSDSRPFMQQSHGRRPPRCHTPELTGEGLLSGAPVGSMGRRPT